MTTTIERPQTVSSSVRRHRRLRSPDLWLALAVSLFCAGVVGYGINRYPWVGGDEGIYASQAWSILHGSIAPYTYSYDHPFVGWAQIAPLAWLAQALHIGGSLSVVNVRAVMVLFAFAQLMLTYGIARRLEMRRVFSVAAVLLLGLSPLWVTEARQVYLDSIALPWVLGAIYLALDPKRRQWTYGMAGVLLGIGILSKETLLLLAPAVAFLVWAKAYRPIRLMSMVSFASFTVLTVFVYPLFALLRKEFLPGAHHVSLWQNGIMYQLASRKGSGALWQAHSVRHELLVGWAQVDPWLIYGGALALLPVLLVKRIRVVGLCFLLWALPMVKPGGYLPSMYVIAVLPFAALSLAGLTDALWTGLLRVRVNARLAAVMVAAVVLGAVGTVGASYLRGDRHYTTSALAATSTRPGEQAVAYVKRHADRRDVILTDDAYWLDLVRAGFGQPWHGALSYYNLDLDPESSVKELPHGWKDISYVIETPSMQGDLAYLGLTKVAATIRHSTVVATYGTGSTQIIVRKVDATNHNHGLTNGA